MADTEFEQFRQYFDKLPQYIKAPAQCYTLVPNIDILLDAESPTSPGPGHAATIPSIQVPNQQNSAAADSSQSQCIGGRHKTPPHDPRAAAYDDSSSDEPFAGDLQLCRSIESSPMKLNTNSSSSRMAPSTTRKRRKLPEVPKKSQQQNEEFTMKRKQENSQWVQPRNTKQLSLAEELFNAEQALLLANNCTKTQPQMNSSQTSDSAMSVSVTESSPISSTVSNKFQNYPNDRPFFLLKFNNHAASHDDESSSDSEKYPSFDSGHSTVQSDDGLKQFSSQMLSSAHGSFSPTSPAASCQIPASHLDVLESTHRGLHKFVPRHHDEIELDIGDPIYVQREADDLWCEGVNLRTGLQGIFPSAYVVDVEYNDFDPSANKVKMERYVVNYLGSIETLYHKGNEVLCQAVKKISSQENYVATHARACILEISDQGIHMVDKGKLVPNHVPCHDYFYALKNVSFCGFHPNDHRYFCFVTKHPTLNRFACHVFMSQDSTRPVAEAVGRAFQRFYQKFLETAYPLEDIYLE